MWIVGLALAVATYPDAYKPLVATDLYEPTKNLSSEELLYGAKVLDRTKDGCGATPECELQAAHNAIDVLNARRAIGRKFYSSIVHLKMIFECMDFKDVQSELSCYRRFEAMPLQTAMRHFGYTRMGVSWAGYSKIRMGMLFEEVEAILGPGIEQSYVSGGGMSHSMYAWRRGSAQIIVSFKDSAVIGRSQIGL